MKLVSIKVKCIIQYNELLTKFAIVSLDRVVFLNVYDILSASDSFSCNRTRQDLTSLFLSNSIKIILSTKNMVPFGKQNCLLDQSFQCLLAFLYR